MREKITLSMSENKLVALEKYLTQKDTTLAAEVDRFAEQLYAKTVPQNVREYIEMITDEKHAKKPRPPKNADSGGTSGQ